MDPESRRAGPQLEVTPVLVVQGQEVDSSPCLLAFQGRGLLAEVPFYAVAEPTSPEGLDLCRPALEGVASSIRSSRSSLTTALVKGLEVCHQWLQGLNLGEPEGGKVGLGLACLGLRGRDVYLAQAGPLMVLLRDSSGLRRLDPRPSREPLGLAPEARVQIHRHAFLTGDALLVASPRLLHLTTVEGLDLVMASPPREASRRLALLAQGEPLFSALFLSLRP